MRLTRTAFVSSVSRNIGAIAPALLTAVILGRHIDFVPIWDGRAYADALTTAVRAPFNPLNFNTFAHPSMLFMLWAGIGQYMDLGNVVLLNLSQLILAVTAVISFAVITRHVFPGAGNRAERFLLTCAFAVYPIVLASEQNFNPDTGVLVFLLAYLALLFERRYLAALLAGMFLVSSKESGVLLYPIATAIFLFVDLKGRKITEMLKEALRRTYAFAPAFFYLTVILAGRLSGRTVVWKKPGGNGNILRLLIPSIDDTRTAYSTGIWVINFNWVMSAVIVAALLKLLVQTLRRRARPPEEMDHRASAIIALLFGIAVYALTRFPTYTNLRYLLPIYPLFLIVFGMALRYLAKMGRLRVATLAMVFGLFFVSAFRTVDPVSKALYGTFRFGRHPILAMTSLTRECCGYGRDQLAYNLEFVHFGTIQNRIFQAVRPTNATAFVLDGLADWYTHGQLDPRTYRRTLRYDDPILPRYRKTEMILVSRNPPAELFFIVYPNVDNTIDFQALARDYRGVEVRTFSEGGYALPVVRMVRREPPV